MELNAISAHVRQYRKDRGWSQAYLAELAGIDRTTLGAFERGRYADIGIRKVQRLLELLGYTLTAAPLGLPTLEQLVAEKESTYGPR